jgi:hypothetical protein
VDIARGEMVEKELDAIIEREERDGIRVLFGGAE